ncbi:MAG: hypothetical protein J5910_03720 [Lachnospiraceae bacterium]|nr:hypothetical protein [Lachnospiraceae bacterium]
MNKLKWAGKEFEWLGRRCVHAITGKYYVDKSKYAGIGFSSDLEANDYIYNGLMSDKPFAVGKTGFSEIGYICCAQNEKYYNSKVHYYWTPSYIRGIEQFKKNKDIRRFYDITLDAMNSLDGIGTYADVFMCDAVLQLLPNLSSICLFNQGVLNCDGGYDVKWTSAIKGKKVLVVSPFFKEVQIQYEKRDLIWTDGRIPECHLEFDPGIWVREKGFFESIEILSDRVLSRDFDVALLACGSVGLALAARIRKSGKKAVQMGSALNILFGLKGKRWDNSGIYNEYWIRPGEDTKPSYANDIDGATYW